MKLINGFLSIATLFIAGQLNAATVFAPTDGDVNFLMGDLAGATLAMFDDSDQTYAGASIDIQMPSIVGIVGPINGDFTAINSASQTLTLTGSDNFILGLSTDGGASWVADLAVNQVGANAYTVLFNNGGTFLQVDVRIVPAVPVPAAVWLFGSGLVGLIGLARRKANA